MRIFAFLSILFLSFAVQESSAQPDYEFIYADSTNKQDSIIDYGATIPEIPLYKTITLKNPTTDTLWLQSRIATYFYLREAEPGDDSFREFTDLKEIQPEVILPFPVIVPPNDSFKIIIRFNSDVTGEIGTKSAFLDLILHKKNPDSIIKVVGRTFFLTVIKTKKLLVNRLPEVSFDSVYVRSTLVKPWIVINASPSPLKTTQTFTKITSGNEFFVLDTLRDAPAGPASENIKIAISADKTG